MKAKSLEYNRINKNLSGKDEDLIEEYSLIIYWIDKNCKEVNYYRKHELEDIIASRPNSNFIKRLARKRARELWADSKRR